MHTVQKAKNLWCPMVRAARHEFVNNPQGVAGSADHIVAGCNTDALGGIRTPASSLCIGDQCGMWRWVPGPPPRDSFDKGVYQPTHGYCGLAGTPMVTS